MSLSLQFSPGTSLSVPSLILRVSDHMYSFTWIHIVILWTKEKTLSAWAWFPTGNQFYTMVSIVWVRTHILRDGKGWLHAAAGIWKRDSSWSLVLHKGTLWVAQYHTSVVLSLGKMKQEGYKLETRVIQVGRPFLKNEHKLQSFSRPQICLQSHLLSLQVFALWFALSKAFP